MIEQNFTFLLLLGSGFVLLRPRDVPLAARLAGRAVGATVRSLRTVKDAAEKTLAEGAQMARRENPEMNAVRNNLKQSLSTFQSLSTTVRRDIADVPLSPVSLLRKGWRSLEDAASDDDNNASPPPRVAVPSRRDASAPSEAAPNLLNDRAIHGTFTHAQSRPLIRKSIAPNGRFMTGADFISRSIEEAALAQQQEKVFGKPPHSPTQEDANSSAPR